MTDPKFTRRSVLRQGIQLPAAGVALFALSACGEDKPKVAACADPNQLSVAENSLRKAGHYVEQSPDPAKTCAGCGFFAAGEKPPCGKCEIFQGPVNAAGHCDSFAAKATG
jgi:hypothetical protein